MSYQNWHIPANYTDAGKLFGMFAIRNAVEAAILAGPCVFLCLRFLPFAITTNIIVALVAGIPLGGFALIGVRDDCLSRFLMIWRRWRRGRGVITFRGSPEQDRVLSETARIKIQKSIQKERDDRQGKKHIANKPGDVSEKR